jgi:hypothetical protein
MSIRDPEVLEALRDRPELLAIADAVEETQRLPRSSGRNVLSRSAALVAVGAAVLVAVLFWPSADGRSPILDRALAAIGNGPVLHLVLRTPTGQQLVDLRSGRTIMPTVDVESWSDQDLKRFHLLYRQSGRVVGEYLYPQDRDGGVQVGPVDPSYAALWSGYREALESGKATIVGKGSLYGQPVYWLRFTSPRSEVAINRTTYELVAFRVTSDTGRHLDSRVLLARTEPFSAAIFERQSSRPNPLTTGSSQGPVVSSAGPSRPGRPWLRAATSIAGLKLAAVHQTQTMVGKKTINGFELVYGSEGSARRSVTIDETKRPTDPPAWRGIPSGFMRLSVGETSERDGAAFTSWSGYLVRHGVYVSITTGVSRDALFRAARALRPA